MFLFKQVSQSEPQRNIGSFLYFHGFIQEHKLKCLLYCCFIVFFKASFLVKAFYEAERNFPLDKSVIAERVYWNSVRACPERVIQVDFQFNCSCLVWVKPQLRVVKCWQKQF